MPAGFKRLRQSTRDLLNELRAYGGKNIQFEFIDPVTGKTEDERKALLEELLSKGLAPANVQTGSANQSKITMVFPCAVAYYYGREYPIQLLENQIGENKEQVLNNSAISLEYKFATAIQKLTMYRPPKIAFLTGNGELNQAELADIIQQLTNLRYEVGMLDISKGYRIKDDFDAVVIAKPTVPFNEKDKYKIDQYIMHGGKVMWLIDPTTADFDSLKFNLTGQFVVDRDLNLDDQLFKYGARVNTDLIEDINMCSPIPLKVGNMGNAPQVELFPWYFFPLLRPAGDHPIVKNLDPVASQFASTVDTIRNPGVKKTILLHTSENSKAVMTPLRVHFGILQQRPKPQDFPQANLPAAVLLEGEFQSLYKNRMTKAFLSLGDSVADLKFIDHSPANKMIVIGDGDIIKNELRKDGSAYPLGYYSVSRQTMSNKEFILNSIQYLIDTSGILETRSKEVKLRLFNKARLQNTVQLFIFGSISEKTYWQIINIIVPIIFIILFGLGFNYFRKKKYAV